MKVIFIRHAARPAHELGDSSLTPHGHAQAEAITLALGPQGPLPTPTRLVSSPKKRAQQTLTPLAQSTRLSLEVDLRLDERRPNEALHEFETRLGSIIDELTAAAANNSAKNEKRNECVYLCSHMDWLEAAVWMVPTDATDNELDRHWANCEYLVFRLGRDGLWQVIKSGVVTPSRDDSPN